LCLLICGCAASKKTAPITASPPATNYNSVVLTVNSEPAGARVYRGGILVGKTPCELTYPIEESSYDTGKMKSPELVVVADGYRPQKVEPSFEIRPQWRPKTIPDQNGTRVAGGKRYPFGHLFLLERDPAAPKASGATAAKSNAASPLDQVQKATGLLLQFKSLAGH